MNKLERLQDGFLNHHFVLTWQNISMLRNLLDLVAENESLWVDVQLSSWECDKNGGVIEPPTLHFSLEGSWRTEHGIEGTSFGYVFYESTIADDATGVAFPAEIQKEREE